MTLRIPECREAICAGDYDAADRLMAELRSQVEELWSAASPAERQSTAAQVLEFLNWARQTVLAKRSHTQRRLLQINRHRAYLPALGSATRCFDFEG